MDKLPAKTFESWPHSHLQDEPIDTAGLPFANSLFGADFPAVVAPDAVTEPTIPLRHTGPEHGRSYELAVGHTDDNGEFIASAVWTDQYDNRFTILTSKGNNFTEPRIFRSATAPSGYIPYGLQETDAMLRVLRASRILRAHQIDTEWPVRIVEPRQIQFEDQVVDQATYKRLLLEKIITRGIDDEPVEAAEAVKIGTALEKLSFFVTLRAMLTSERPADLLSDETREAAESRIKRAIRIATIVVGEPELAIKDEYYGDFMTKFLPQQLGTHLAMMHDAGLSHGFPTCGNVTLLGGIVDLDSVKGEPLGLGDKPVDVKAFARDLNYIHGNSDDSDMAEVLGHLKNLGVITIDDQSIFKVLLHETYFQQRQFDVTLPQDAAELLGIYYEMGQAPYTNDQVSQMHQATDTLCGGQLQPADIYDEAELLTDFGSWETKHFELSVAIALDTYLGPLEDRSATGAIDLDIKELTWVIRSYESRRFKDRHRRRFNAELVPRLVSEFGYPKPTADLIAHGFWGQAMHGLPSPVLEDDHEEFKIYEAAIFEYFGKRMTRSEYDEVVDLQTAGHEAVNIREYLHEQGIDMLIKEQVDAIEFFARANPRSDTLEILNQPLEDGPFLFSSRSKPLMLISDGTYTELLVHRDATSYHFDFNVKDATYVGFVSHSRSSPDRIAVKLFGAQADLEAIMHSVQI